LRPRHLPAAWRVGSELLSIVGPAARWIDSAAQAVNLFGMPKRRRTAATLSLWVALALTVPAAAHAVLEPARTALGRGDYAAAEPLLRNARGADRAEADRLLGRLLMETGRYDDARQLGQRIGHVPATHVEGLTLEGEALAAVGSYD